MTTGTIATTAAGTTKPHGRPIKWWTSVVFLCAILGALIGLSFKTQKKLLETYPSSNYEGLAAKYLIVEKSDKDAELTIKSLQNEVRRLETTLPMHNAQFQVLSDDLAQSKFLAGLTDVSGPGVVVTLNDSKKRFPDAPLSVQMTEIIHDTDILQTVNELKAAGAEAVSVNDQRLVATSPIRCAGPTIYINGTPQTPPYVINAIGDPKVLETALKLPQGVYDTLTGMDPAMIQVQHSAKLLVPAYNGPTATRFAHVVAPSTTDSDLSKGTP